MTVTRFHGGEYALIPIPRGNPILLIWVDMPNDEFSWLNCPMRDYASTVLVWHNTAGRWMMKT